MAMEDVDGEVKVSQTWRYGTQKEAEKKRGEIDTQREKSQRRV